MTFESVDFTRSHWSEETRVAAGALGGFLLGRAVFGRGLLRPVFGVAGGALLARAVANRPLRRALREGAEEAGALGEQAREEATRRAGEVARDVRGGAERARTAARSAGEKVRSGLARSREAPGRARDGGRRSVDEVKSPAEGPARQEPPRGGEGHGPDVATGVPGDEPYAGGPPVEPPAAGGPGPSAAKDARAGSETEFPSAGTPREGKGGAGAKREEPPTGDGQ